MAQLIPNLKQKFFDADGEPLEGGLLYSYAAGTSTPLATFQDANATVPNSNPIVLDANGEANIFATADAYKFVLADADDVVLWTVDNVKYIGAGSVDSVAIQDGAVTTPKIADLAVTTAKIDDLQVTAGKIADGAVQTGKINDGAVTTAKFADLSVTTQKLADGSVTTVKLGDLAVTTAKMADGSVTTDKLGNLAVTTAKLADASVTPLKRSSWTRGGSPVLASSTTSTTWQTVATAVITPAKLLSQNPIFFLLGPNLSGTASQLTGSSGAMRVRIILGTTTIAEWSFTGSIPANLTAFDDLQGVVGSNTYNLQFAAATSATATWTACQFTAYQI